MLKDYSTDYVLIGHSEQRQHYKEDNISLRLKKPMKSLKKYEGKLKGFSNEKIEVDISNGLEENLFIDPAIIKSINVVWSPKDTK